MTTNLDSENQFLQRLRITFRAAVILNWLVMITILFLREIPKPVAMGAFTVFRVTVICATLWLLIETAEAITKRTLAASPLIDATLTLPMFGFWFLAWVSSLD